MTSPKPLKDTNSLLDHEVLKKKLASGDSFGLTVVSDSMEPLIMTGETIWPVAPPAAQELKIFDIILFRQGQKLNAHFLTKVDSENDLFITRPLKDPRHQDYPLKYNDIVGLIAHKKISLWQKLRVLLLS